MGCASRSRNWRLQGVTANELNPPSPSVNRLADSIKGAAIVDVASQCPKDGGGYLTSRVLELAYVRSRRPYQFVRNPCAKVRVDDCKLQSELNGVKLAVEVNKGKHRSHIALEVVQ